MLKKLMLALTVLSMAACAFNNDESNGTKQNKQQADYNARAQETFSKVEGTYTGNLVRENGATEVIQITLILASVKTGQNTDGSAIIQYKQKAAYTRLNPASRAITDLDVSYTPETGVLNILNSAAATNDDVQSIFTTIKDGIMTGVVKSRSGIIGRFTLKYVVGGSANGGNGADEEYYARLRKEYAAISGTYVGCVIPTKDAQQRGHSYRAKITLSIYEQQTSAPTSPGSKASGSDQSAPGSDQGSGSASPDQTSKPILAGRFHRNFDDLGSFDGSLTGIYRSDFIPATLTLTGSYQGQTNGYATTFNGSLNENGEYIADFTSNKFGTEGKMYFKKGQTYPAKCANVR